MDLKKVIVVGLVVVLTNCVLAYVVVSSVKEFYKPDVVNIYKIYLSNCSEEEMSEQENILDNICLESLKENERDGRREKDVSPVSA